MFKIDRDKNGIALLDTFSRRLKFSTICFLGIIGLIFIWTIGIPINFSYWIITGKSLSRMLIN